MAKVPDSGENAEKCICPNCPTWKSDACAAEKKETLYCGRGKTACKLEDKTCICGQCPIWYRYSLSNYYYCFTGEAE